MTHPEQQRRAYLQAMGIDVWLPRDAADDDGPAERRPGTPVAEDGSAGGDLPRYRAVDVFVDQGDFVRKAPRGVF